jgi:hypothetical protein
MREYEKDRFSPNVGKEITLRCVISEKSADLTYFIAEA